MKKIQVLICKIAGFLLKLFGRGSNFPGVLALKFDKNILSYFKMPKKADSKSYSNNSPSP